MTVYFSLGGLTPSGDLHATSTFRAEVTPTSSYALVTGIGTVGARNAQTILIQNGEPTAIRVSCTPAGSGNDSTARDILAGQGLLLWLGGDANVYVKTI